MTLNPLDKGQATVNVGSDLKYSINNSPFGFSWIQSQEIWIHCSPKKAVNVLLCPVFLLKITSVFPELLYYAVYLQYVDEVV